MAKTKIFSMYNFFLIILALDLLVLLMPFEATATRPISATTISTSSSPEADPQKPYSSPMQLIPAALAPSPTVISDDDVHQSNSHLNGASDDDDDECGGDGHESEEECIMRKSSMFEHTDYIYTQDFNDHHYHQHKQQHP